MPGLKYGPGHIDEYPISNKPDIAHPLDLRYLYLVKQAFAGNKAQYKRWLLTAFIPPNERGLIEIPHDFPETTKDEINNHIMSINTLLQTPADNEHNLVDLKLKLETLFNKEHWLAIALDMKDSVHIDTLNSLLQWQATFVQFSSDQIVFHTTKNTALIPQTKVPYHVSSLADKKLHDIVFAEITLAINDKIGKLTNIQFRRATHEQLFCQMPSALLREHFLRDQHSFILPLYILGALRYEYFVTGAYFNARPIHQYLRGGTNCTEAHGEQYGEAMMIGHDDVHVRLYAPDEKQNLYTEQELEQFMFILAVIANVLARLEQSDNANCIIDTPTQIRSVYQTLHNNTNETIRFLNAIYSELLYITDLKANSFACELGSTENQSTAYKMIIKINDQDYIFEGKLDRISSNPLIHTNVTELILHRHLEELNEISLEHKQANTAAPLLTPTAVPDSTTSPNLNTITSSHYKLML